MVKSTNCSCRGLRFYPSIHRYLQLSLTPVSGDLSLYSATDTAGTRCAYSAQTVRTKHLYILNEMNNKNMLILKVFFW